MTFGIMKFQFFDDLAMWQFGQMTFEAVTFQENNE